MTKWKYMKGSEKDFTGAHAVATHKYVHKELGHPVYTANPEIIKEVLFDLVAVREPITNCTFQDGVVFDAPIGMPLNEFKCRQQSMNASESNARNRKSRNQKNWYSGTGFLKAMFKTSKKHYRRDRVLRRLCDLNMKKLVKEMTK